MVPGGLERRQVQHYEEHGWCAIPALLADPVDRATGVAGGGRRGRGDAALVERSGEGADAGRAGVSPEDSGRMSPGSSAAASMLASSLPRSLSAQ